MYPVALLALSSAATSGIFIAVAILCAVFVIFFARGRRY
jgi:hypothetical protein